VLQAAWADGNSGSAGDYQNDYTYHWTPNSAEYRWLQQDLAAHPTALKFAFFHYPIYSDNSVKSSNPFLQGTARLEELLSHYGVDIAFSGHGHIYQRNIKPHDNSLITYVTGGGGARLAPIGALGCSAVDAYGIGWSYTASGGVGRGSACGTAPVPQTPQRVFHLLLVHVDGTSVTVEPVDSLGESFDVQTYKFAATADNNPPTQPTGLSSRINNTQLVELRWNAAADDTGVRGYTIYRDDILLTTVEPDNLSYVDTTVAASTTYRYTIDAFDANSNHSPRSPAVTISTPKADIAPPSAPANLSASVVSATRVDLAWTAATDDSGVAGYTIRRNGQVLVTLEGDATAYSDESTLPGSIYRYSILAFDRFDNHSPSSAEATAQTPRVVLLPLIMGDGAVTTSFYASYRPNLPKGTDAAVADNIWAVETPASAVQETSASSALYICGVDTPLPP
jgi:hypothetical protein